MLIIFKIYFCEGLERWSPNARSIFEDYITPMKRKLRAETLENFEENIEEYVESPKKKTKGFSLEGISHSTKIVYINILVNITIT